MTNPRPHVLIVGAGPTGLTAAVELRRRGASVRVVERRANLSNLSRAVGIQPRSMKILEASGVAESVAAEAVVFQGVILHAGARELARLPLDFSEDSRLWGLAQNRTEHHLLEALTRLGGQLEFGAEFESLEQSKNGVTAQVGGREVRSDYLIGADGVRSTVRAKIGSSYDGFDLPGRWSIADVEAVDWPDANCFKGYLLPEGQVCVVVPLEAQRFRVISSLPDALAALPVPMSVDNIRNQGTFNISVRQVSHYQKGRVFLAGDAAHCHSPAGGRGMNLGIADAADLAERLVTGRIEGYHSGRHREGAHVLRFSENARRKVMSPRRRPFLRAALVIAKLAPPLGRLAMRRFVSG